MQDEGPCVPFALPQIRSGGVLEVGCRYKEAQEAGAAPRARHASAMLNAQERAHIAQVWDLIAGHEAPFGAELLLRWVGAGSLGSLGGDRGLWPESRGGRPDYGFQVSGRYKCGRDPRTPALPTDLLPQAFHRVPQHQDLLQTPGRLP